MEVSDLSNQAFESYYKVRWGDGSGALWPVVTLAAWPCESAASAHVPAVRAQHSHCVQEQGIVPAGEWDDFLRVCKTILPITFRHAGRVGVRVRAARGQRLWRAESTT